MAGLTRHDASLISSEILSRNESLVLKWLFRQSFSKYVFSKKKSVSPLKKLKLWQKTLI
jgi:hypothetical protein